ncbi:hypothetical protein DFH11DRAFT_1731431 [Phellopilus nigrolimitatus]|nr:hypothetical protein DFH11DRAFT_1731431 [Phellopilus nigrolimitatus]
MKPAASAAARSSSESRRPLMCECEAIRDARVVDEKDGGGNRQLGRVIGAGSGDTHSPISAHPYEPLLHPPSAVSESRPIPNNPNNPALVQRQPMTPQQAAAQHKVRQANFLQGLAKIMATRHMPLPSSISGIEAGYDPIIFTAGGAGEIQQQNAWPNVLHHFNLPEYLPHPQENGNVSTAVAIAQLYSILLGPFKEIYYKNIPDSQKQALMQQGRLPIAASAGPASFHRHNMSPLGTVGSMAQSQPPIGAEALGHSFSASSSDFDVDSEARNKRKLDEYEEGNGKRSRRKTDSESPNASRGGSEAVPNSHAPTSAMAATRVKPSRRKIEYVPLARKVETAGGRDVNHIQNELTRLSRGLPVREINEWGKVYVDALTMSLQLVTNRQLVSLAHDEISYPFASEGKNQGDFDARVAGPMQRRADIIRLALNILRNLSAASDNQAFMARHPILIDLLLSITCLHSPEGQTPRAASTTFSLPDLIAVQKEVLSIFVNLSGSVNFPSASPSLSSEFRSSLTSASASAVDAALEVFTRISQPDSNRKIISSSVSQQWLWRLFEALVHRLPSTDHDYKLVIREESWMSYLEKLVLDLYSLAFLMPPEMKQRVKEDRSLSFAKVMLRFVKRIMSGGPAQAELRMHFASCARCAIETMKVIDDGDDSFDASQPNVPTLSFGVGYSEVGDKKVEKLSRQHSVSERSPLSVPLPALSADSPPPMDSPPLAHAAHPQPARSKGGANRLGQVTHGREYSRRLKLKREQLEGQTCGPAELSRSASESGRSALPPPSPPANSTRSNSDYPTQYPPPGAPEAADKRRGRKPKDADSMNMQGPPTPVPKSVVHVPGRREAQATCWRRAEAERAAVFGERDAG